MNAPPTRFIRVMPDDLRRFVSNVLQKVEVPQADADIIAELMVDTDLRGVFSHGTNTLPGYSRVFTTRGFNPMPVQKIIKDTPIITMIDGDGGLGHLTTHLATMIAIEKAKKSELSMAVTRHHGHFGSAGKYVRLAVKEGLICFCVSGLLARMPEDPNTSAWAHYPLDNCPLSIGFPAEEGYPVIVDICSSVMDEWDVTSDRFQSIFSQMPAVVFRSFGLRAACDFLSAALGDMMRQKFRDSEREYSNAYYGAFLWVLDPAAFVDPTDFKTEVDRTTDLIAALQPLPGYDKANLPGGPEYERELEYNALGIPLGESHQNSLETIGDEIGVLIPWR
jgi:LDH2 family malate/lactate/ureidoglycolate dehydrogenase